MALELLTYSQALFKERWSNRSHLYFLWSFTAPWDIQGWFLVIQRLLLNRLSVDFHFHAPTGVFVKTKGCGNLINNLGDLNDLQAFSPECRHPNIKSEEEFGLLLCWIAIFGGFTYLHGLRRQSASLKLGNRLPIASFVVKSYTGMRERGIVPQQRPRCPTEAEEIEDNDGAQHSPRTAWFPWWFLAVIRRLVTIRYDSRDG